MKRTTVPNTFQRTQQLHAHLAAASISSTSQTTTTDDEGIDVISTNDNALLLLKAPVYDVRHPTYVGLWERSMPNIHDDISMDDVDEPHLKRKHLMLSLYPNIEQLYSIEWKTKYIALILVSIQLCLAYQFGSTSGYQFHMGWLVLTSYVIGGTLTSIFGVLIHEVTHNLAFYSRFLNRILGLFINLGIVFPISASFRRYHLEHHTFQGVIGKDPDLPMPFEYKLIKGNPFMKFIWVFFFPALYVLRGAAMRKSPQFWEIINWVWTVAFDLLTIQLCGLRGFLYLFLSLWFGYGIHPGAAHFIQEHYTFHDGQETMSYYGVGNWPLMNIGLHNEHHDFTKIPWSKLPELHRIAPEFYFSLASHSSWCKVIWDFIFCDYLGPQSRLGRTLSDHKNGRSTVAAARKVFNKHD